VIELRARQVWRDSVAQIITFGTMGREIRRARRGRVMGLDYGACDRLAKMIPNELKMTLKKALEQSPDFKAAYETEDQTHELIDTAFVLEDLTRNASVHAAGVVHRRSAAHQFAAPQEGRRGFPCDASTPWIPVGNWAC